MNTYKCNKVRRFLCKLSHRQCNHKSVNVSNDITEEDLPVFIKNKSGRWINKTTGRYVKKEVAEAYVNHQC